MQLNSLSLNSNTSSANSKTFLAIYDHNLVVVNQQVFVFGKTFSNFSIQTPLHKINMVTLKAEPVYGTNAPIFQQFIMFSFERRIYFFGKKPESQNNQLYQFDGCKFNQLDQNGSIPYLSSSYSFTIFSHQYLLLFLCLTQNQLQNKWYIFDIKKRLWKQIISDIQIPICQKSSILWKNARGYLLLQSAYIKNHKSFRKNILYQLQFANFNQSIIKCQQIEFKTQIQNENLTFTQIFTFKDNYIMILGGKQDQFPYQGKQYKNDQQNYLNNIKNKQKNFNEEQNNLQEQQKNFKEEKAKLSLEKQTNKKIKLNNKKIIYKFDLELFQWSNQFHILNVQGYNHKIVTYDYKLLFIAGNSQNNLIQNIQIEDFKSLQTNKSFSYQQSLCYYCECAFTYDQKAIYQPMIQKQYQIYGNKNVIENKFLKKLSQSIANEIQALGIIFQFFVNTLSHQIRINLCQQIQTSSYVKKIKNKIQSAKTQIIQIKGSSFSLLKKDTLVSIFQNRMIKQKQHEQFEQLDLFLQNTQHENFYMNFLKLKSACFKLGVAFLYVTLTEGNQIFVGYCSYSQTNFPQSDYDSVGQIYYLIKFDRNQRKNYYSSLINKDIIFQNVKLYFGAPNIYQDSVFNETNNSHNYNSSLFIIEVNKLQKSFNIQVQKNKYFQDIRIKSTNLMKNNLNTTNSLRNYLKHLFLLNQLNGQKLKIFLQNQEVQVVDLYQKYYELSKQSFIKVIYTTQQNSSLTKSIRNQLQQTHFSENHDEIYISNAQKKPQIIQKCTFYRNISKKNNKLFTLNDLYNKKIFIYKDKKLTKTISTKKQIICGIIELNCSTQIVMNETKFSSKKQQRKLNNWIQEIQNSLHDDFMPSNQDL